MHQLLWPVHTVAEKWDCLTKVRLSHFYETVSLFCDSVDRPLVSGSVTWVSVQILSIGRHNPHTVKCYVLTWRLELTVIIIERFGQKYFSGVGKMRNCGMRNAEGKMWNRKCGTTLIGRSSEPRDRYLSAYYRNGYIYIAIGRVVKCGPEMRKMQTLKQECIWYQTHTL